jgi:hypothetical protein
MASASTSCFRESGSAVARGGRPGDKIANPMFLCVAECNNMGAGLRLSSGDLELESDAEFGGGDVGSSLIRLLKWLAPVCAH